MEYSLETVLDHVKKQSFSDISKLVRKIMLQSILLDPLLVLITQLYLTLCDPIDCSLPGSSAHGISQARILEWVAIPFSRESSQARDETQVSRIASSFFTI